jgi:hypothetical protein
MVEKEKLEEQIGEVLGLEMAAQKAVEELSSKGLLDERGLKVNFRACRKRLETTRKELNRSCKEFHSHKV